MAKEVDEAGRGEKTGSADRQKKRNQYEKVLEIQLATTLHPLL